MSDLFDYADEGPDWERTAEGLRNKPLKGAWDREAARRRDAERHEHRKEWREKYRLDLSNAEYRALDYAAETMRADAGDAEAYHDNWYRLGTAMKLGRQNGLPFEYAYANLDTIMKNQFPKLDTPRKWYRAVSDHARIGAINYELSGLAWELRLAKGTAERNRIWTKMEALSGEMEGLYDSAGRNFIVDGLKVAAESLPVSIEGTAARMVGSLVHPAVGFLAGSAASARSMIGLEYYSLLKEGVEEDAAWKAALASGVIQGVFEQVSGPEAMMGNTGLGLKIVKKLHFGGFFGAFARAAGAQFFENIGEGLTEGAQEVTSQLFTEGAKSATERKAREAAAAGMLPGSKTARGSPWRHPVERAAEDLATAAYREYLKQMAESEGKDAALPRDTAAMKRDAVWQSMYGGFVASFVTGAVTVPGNVMVNAVDALKVNAAAAVSATLEEFQERTKDTYVEKMPELQKEIFETARSGIEQTEAAKAEELRNRRLYGALDTGGEVYRGEGGELYTENERRRESGAVSGTYAAGNPRKGADEARVYAVVDYEMRGDALEITSVRTGQRHEDLKGELLQGFANDMGREFVWDGEAYAPDGKDSTAVHVGWDEEASPKAPAAMPEEAALADTGAKAAEGPAFNREGYTAPDTDEDTAAKARFQEQILAAGTKVQSGAEAEALTRLYDAVGRKWFNSGFADFMAKLSKDPDRLIVPMTDADAAGWYQNALSAEELAARGIDPANLTEEQRRRAADFVHGATVVGSDGVARAIKAAKSADVSTFIHEGMHAFTLLAKRADPELYGMMMAAAGLDAAALQRADPKTVEKAYEKLAYDLERYVKKGELPEGAGEETRGLFEKLKAFLRDIARIIVEDIAPETKALFDGLFGEEGPGGAQTGAEGKRHGGGAIDARRGPCDAIWGK